MKKINRAEAKALGLKRFFTGKPCPKNHISERYVSANACCECLMERKLVYAQKNKKPPKKLLIETVSKETKEKKREYARKYYHLKKEKIKKLSSTFIRKEKRKKYIREWASSYRKSPFGKVISFMRKSVLRCIKNKNDRTHEILGYSKDELVFHIERQFQKNMSWENYGKWHIDHIVPIGFFLKSGIDDPKVINALTNLRPIWAHENLSKSDNKEFLI